MQQLQALVMSVMGALITGLIFGGIKMYQTQQVQEEKIRDLQKDVSDEKVRNNGQDVAINAQAILLSRIDANVSELLAIRRDDVHRRA